MHMSMYTYNIMYQHLAGFFFFLFLNHRSLSPHTPITNSSFSVVQVSNACYSLIYSYNVTSQLHILLRLLYEYLTCLSLSITGPGPDQSTYNGPSHSSTTTSSYSDHSTCNIPSIGEPTNWFHLPALSIDPQLQLYFKITVIEEAGVQSNVERSWFNPQPSTYIKPFPQMSFSQTIML